MSISLSHLTHCRNISYEEARQQEIERLFTEGRSLCAAMEAFMSQLPYLVALSLPSGNDRGNPTSSSGRVAKR